MKLQHIQQPEGSFCCGQACVAMLAGISLQTAIQAFGHQHRTKPREVQRQLRRLGLGVAGRRDGLRRIKGGYLPPTALVKMLPPKGIKSSRSHWVVIHDGVVYDPACPEGSVSSGRFSSYFAITLPPAKE